MFRALALALSLAPSTVLAQDAAAEESDDVQHKVSVTWGPLNLVVPAVEFCGELRLYDQIGAALVFGYGWPTAQLLDGEGNVLAEEDYKIFEFGGQFRYYALGNFVHGMQVGAELMYVYAARDEDDTIAASADGLAVSPFVGYKIATNVGFTFDAQAGVTYIAARAEAEETTSGQTAEAEDSAFLPFLNLNVGWSF